MDLHKYFENAKGLGVLATADTEGHVDVALYARPHVVDDETVSFIMSERLSHANVTANPNAAYLFIESGPGYKGTRLYLKKTKEETDPERIEALRRENRKGHDYGEENRYLVTFKVEEARALTGD